MAKILNAVKLFETVVCVFVEMTMTHAPKHFNFKNPSDCPHHSFKPENKPLSLNERCFRALVHALLGFSGKKFRHFEQPSLTLKKYNFNILQSRLTQYFIRQ